MVQAVHRGGGRQTNKTEERDGHGRGGSNVLCVCVFFLWLHALLLLTILFPSFWAHPWSTVRARGSNHPRLPPCGIIPGLPRHYILYIYIQVYIYLSREGLRVTRERSYCTVLASFASVTGCNSVLRPVHLTRVPGWCLAKEHAFCLPIADRRLCVPLQ